MFSIRIVPLLAGVLLLTLTADADACGRRSRPMVTASYPCSNPCSPCYPAFSLHAGSYEGNGLVPWTPDRPVHLPLEIGVTNLECHRWAYASTEYGFCLLDDRGCLVPHALILTPDARTVCVLPRTTVLDRPGVSVAPGVLQLGRRYTVVVTLRGKAACFPFTPVLFAGPKQ